MLFISYASGVGYMTKLVLFFIFSIVTPTFDTLFELFVSNQPRKVYKYNYFFLNRHKVIKGKRVRGLSVNLRK